MAQLEIGFEEHKGFLLLMRLLQQLLLLLIFFPHKPLRNLKTFSFTFPFPLCLYCCIESHEFVITTLIYLCQILLSQKICRFFFFNYTVCMHNFEATTSTNIWIRTLACLHGSHTAPESLTIPNLEGIWSFGNKNDTKRVLPWLVMCCVPYNSNGFQMRKKWLDEPQHWGLQQADYRVYSNWNKGSYTTQKPSLWDQ